MDRGISYSEKREAQYGRLVHNVLNALNEAVRHRVDEGETRTSISSKIGCERSSLSRALNGNVRNLTLRTISDILWATRYEPQDFTADPIEVISPNYICDNIEIKSGKISSVFPSSGRLFVAYTTSKDGRIYHNNKEGLVDVSG